MPEQLMTISQVAKLLCCHTMTVRRLIKSGALGEVVRTSHQFVRVKAEAVNAYISKHTEELIR
jgi:excisionase family DNA binding protein